MLVYISNFLYFYIYNHHQSGDVGGPHYVIKFQIGPTPQCLSSHELCHFFLLIMQHSLPKEMTSPPSTWSLLDTNLEVITHDSCRGILCLHTLKGSTHIITPSNYKIIYFFFGEPIIKEHTCTCTLLHVAKPLYQNPQLCTTQCSTLWIARLKILTWFEFVSYNHKIVYSTARSFLLVIRFLKAN